MTRRWILDPKQSCPGAQFQFSQADDAAVLTTATLKVELSLKRGNLKYSSISGQDLLREGDAMPRTYEPAQVNGESTYHVADRFRPDATEGFYGLGQHQSGMFNYRGSTVELGQNNTDVAIPLLVSSKGYAVSVEHRVVYLRWTTGFRWNSRSASLAGDSVDYYMIYGPEMDQIIHEYRGLTGHTPMLPKWAYGFFQSKDRYVSQEETSRDCASLSRAAHSAGCDRAGLVLVEDRRRSRFQFQFYRRSRRTQDTA